jgi:hypothetical protein
LLFLENTTGSLILGGYDTARFNATSTLSISMPGANNSTLAATLDSVHIHGQSEVAWPEASGLKAIQVRIDSVLPQMWLPLEICLMFEKAFGLSWNDTLQLYLVDDDTHATLLKTNPSVTFKISGIGAATQRFVLPYSAFDLQVASPLVEGVANYFPLKRATNWTQYLLGRTFLQEVYLTVDYERNFFSLSQLYPPGGLGDILPIYNTEYDSLESNDTGLSTGAYAGIGVGVGLAVLILLGLVLSWRQGWGFFRKKPLAPDTIGKAELHGEPVSLAEVVVRGRAELPAKHVVEAMDRETTELETVERSQEIESPMSPRVGGLGEVYELDAEQIRRSWSFSMSSSSARHSLEK